MNKNEFFRGQVQEYGAILRLKRHWFEALINLLNLSYADGPSPAGAELGG